MNVTVANINDAPVVSTVGNQSTNEDTPLIIPFTVNDADPGDTLSVTVGSSNPTLLPAGALSLGGAGANRTLTVTTPLNLNGTAQVFLSVSDGHAAPVIQDILLTVNPVNDAPVITQGPGPLPLSVDEDDSNGEQVTVSATDVENDSLTWSANDPAHGTVTNVAGVFTYTPDANFDGSESFTITANDGHGGTDTIQVNVTIDPSTDAPAFATASVIGSGDEETAIAGSVTATDPDTGDTLTYSVESGDEAADGTAGVNPATGTWTYTGDLDFVGTDSFIITVTDGDSLTDTIEVNLTVDNVNDNPAFGAGGDSGNGDEETLITGTVTATDVENDSLTYSIEAGDEATDGTANVNPTTGAWDYTGDLDFAGNDSFTITVSDGNGGTDTIPVTVTVDNLNDDPVFGAGGDSGSGDEELLITGTVSATDPDTADTLTYSIEAGDEATDGTAAVNPTTGAWDYTGDLDFAGSDSFTITVSDGNGGSDTIQVNVTVNNLNDNPTASNITISGPALTGINGTIVASDPDGDTVTFTIEPGDEPGVPNLAVVYPNGDVTFTGMLGFITDSFIVTLSDGNGGTSQVTVTVNEVLGL